MNTGSTTFCVARCCRSAGLTLVVGFAALWAVASVRGNAPGTPVSDLPTVVLDLHHPRVVVVKSKRRLYILDGRTLVRTYPIALGPEPAGDKRLAGDGRTPVGLFRVCTKNRHSSHHRFLGIDYPNAQTARRGLDQGLLTAGEARAIAAAADQGRCPPWLTAVGGGIGIHGGGIAPTRSGADWTAGCIALADRDVDELFEVLRSGDTVEILP